MESNRTDNSSKKNNVDWWSMEETDENNLLSNLPETPDNNQTDKNIHYYIEKAKDYERTGCFREAGYCYMDAAKNSLSVDKKALYIRKAIENFKNANNLRLVAIGLERLCRITLTPDDYLNAGEAFSKIGPNESSYFTKAATFFHKAAIEFASKNETRQRAIDAYRKSAQNGQMKRDFGFAASRFNDLADLTLSGQDYLDAAENFMKAPVFGLAAKMYGCAAMYSSNIEDKIKYLKEASEASGKAGNFFYERKHLEDAKKLEKERALSQQSGKQEEQSSNQKSGKQEEQPANQNNNPHIQNNLFPPNPPYLQAVLKGQNNAQPKKNVTTYPTPFSKRPFRKN